MQSDIGNEKPDISQGFAETYGEIGIFVPFPIFFS